jgi:hypothetical protein
MCPGFPRGRPATGSLINEIVLGEESDVGSLAQRKTAVLQPFVLYLDRHIELDEHHHGPMALEMLAELCGDEVQRGAVRPFDFVEHRDERSHACANASAAPATRLIGDVTCSIPEGRGKITSAE